MIPAFDAIKAINQKRKNEIVVGTMTPNRYWELISNNPDMDLPIFGAMGKASSVGLGLALAKPEEKIWVLDGDGSILMNLGSLVTISEQKPKNLWHFVFQDGIYFTTGGQPIPGGDKVDLSGIAIKSGFAEVYTFDNLEHFVNELDLIVNTKGPVFVCLKIKHSKDAPGMYIGSTKMAVDRLMNAIN